MFSNKERALQQIIEECIRDGILVDYLRERRVEVTRIMHELLTQETALRMHDLQFEKRIEELEEELAEQDREIEQLKAKILQLEGDSVR